VLHQVNVIGNFDRGQAYWRIGADAEKPNEAEQQRDFEFHFAILEDGWQSI
jgi:hypothetical protein